MKAVLQMEFSRVRLPPSRPNMRGGPPRLIFLDVAYAALESRVYSVGIASSCLTAIAAVLEKEYPITWIPLVLSPDSKEISGCKKSAGNNSMFRRSVHSHIVLQVQFPESMLPRSGKRFGRSCHVIGSSKSTLQIGASCVLELIA